MVSPTSRRIAGEGGLDRGEISKQKQMGKR